MVAVGDIACRPGKKQTAIECHQRETSDLALRLDPDIVLLLGDLQYERGELANFNAVFAPTWGRLLTRTRPAPGNHEYATKNGAGYYGYFGARAHPAQRGWYSFSTPTGWHLVALNSNCAAVGGCAVGSPQERWLRTDLKRSTARCTLAYWHHPRFSSGLHGSAPEMAPLYDALHDAGAELVLTGHDHDYERFAPLDADGRPGHIRQFVVGTGGRSAYSFKQPISGSEARHTGTFGVLSLELSRSGYSWRFVPVRDGGFTDSGRADCS